MRHMRDPRLDAPVLGDVLVRRDPAAAGHRLMLGGNDASVAELADFGRRTVLADGVAHVAGVVVGELPGVRAFADAMLQDVGKGRAGLGQVGGQAVHAGIRSIAYDQLLLGVEHAQALRHVVQSCIEPQVLRLQLLLLRQQLFLLGAQEALGFV